MKLSYNFTGRKAETLFKSLDECHFEEMVEKQAEYYEEDAKPGVCTEVREEFIEHILWQKLDGDDLDEIAKKARLRGKGNAAIKKWLLTHECPVLDEDALRREWAYERANYDAQDGVLWDHFDKNDDVEAALELGFVKYPPYDDKRKRYKRTKEKNTISAKVANRIHELSKTMEGLDYKSEEYEKLRKKRNTLEREAVEKLIFIDGFECDYCRGEVDYPEVYPLSDLPKCPDCGTLVCPDCSIKYGNPAINKESARAYFDALVAGNEEEYGAVCGYCGYGEYDFLVVLLKVLKCPVPEIYKDKDSFEMLRRLSQATAA